MATVKGEMAVGLNSSGPSRFEHKTPYYSQKGRQSMKGAPGVRMIAS